MIKYLITFIFFAFNSYGALEVTIAQGKVEPTPIACLLYTSPSPRD